MPPKSGSSRDEGAATLPALVVYRRRRASRVSKIIGAAWPDVIKVSIYRAAGMTRVKLCEAADNGKSPCFQLGVRRNNVAQALGLLCEPPDGSVVVQSDGNFWGQSAHGKSFT